VQIWLMPQSKWHAMKARGPRPKVRPLRKDGIESNRYRLDDRNARPGIKIARHFET
jgi:hypothetical protein